MKIAYENRKETIDAFYTTILSDMPHVHKEIEIVMVENGSVLAYADKACFELKANDIYISFPNQVHYYKNCIQGNYYVIIFSANLIYGQKNTLCSNVPTNNRIAETTDMCNLLTELFRAYKRKSLTECVGYLNLFMGSVLPRFTLSPALTTDNSTLREILEYCSSHYTEKISLDTVASELHISKYYISRLINTKLNLGFNDYINMLRVNAACDMLAENNKKIADISEDVGFGAIRSMNRSFKQMMNMTPLEYRNMKINESH